MRLVDRELIESIADATDTEIRDDYSGRAMYGERCFGLVTDTGGFAQFIARLREADSLLAGRLSASLREDGMGLHTIYYFPGFQLDGQSADDRDDA